MTRIVAGTARGRRLKVPPRGTRPTSERVREAVFSAVGHRLGGWDDLTVVDLFAGSGALGLEAWSRGADRVVLVENDHRALAAIKGNVAELRAEADVQVLGADAYRLPERSTVITDRGPADVVLIDPPYAHTAERIAGLLEMLAQGHWVAPGALVVLERPAVDAPWDWPAGWEAVTDRRYGDTWIWQGVLVASN